MIGRQAHNLRSEDWHRVDARALLERIKQDHRQGDTTWTVTPWSRNQGGDINRSYLIHSTDGGLYAIFFRKVSHQ